MFPVNFQLETLGSIIGGYWVGTKKQGNVDSDVQCDCKEVSAKYSDKKLV